MEPDNSNPPTNHNPVRGVTNNGSHTAADPEQTPSIASTISSRAQKPAQPPLTDSDSTSLATDDPNAIVIKLHHLIGVLIFIFIFHMLHAGFTAFSFSDTKLSVLLGSTTALADQLALMGSRSGVDAHKYDKYYNHTVENMGSMFLVTQEMYYDWFLNGTTEEACEESRKSICTDCEKCSCVRNVTAEELRRVCPSPFQSSVTDTSGQFIVQASLMSTGSSFQFRMIEEMLKFAGLTKTKGLYFSNSDNLKVLMKLKTVKKLHPQVIKTHVVSNALLENKVADIIFTPFKQSEVCARTMPTTYKKKTCRCCFSSYATRKSRQVRLAEAHMMAASLNLPVEAIDFENLLNLLYEYFADHSTLQQSLAIDFQRNGTNEHPLGELYDSDPTVRYDPAFEYPGPYYVTSAFYTDWFMNQSDAACVESRNICKDCSKCACVRRVSRDQLKAMCPSPLKSNISSTSGHMIVQAALSKTGGNWQAKALLELLRFAGFNQANLTIHPRADPLEPFVEMKKEANRYPMVIRTSSVGHRVVENQIADIIFSTFRQFDLCFKYHPTRYKQLTCRCCMSNFASRNSPEVRMAEAQMWAASLNLPLDKIDFNKFIQVMNRWYARAYKYRHTADIKPSSSSSSSSSVSSVEHDKAAVYIPGFKYTGSYFVTSTIYYDWFQNKTAAGCEQSKRDICKDCHECPCVKQVTLDQLKSICPPFFDTPLKESPGKIILQASGDHPSSAWQFKSLEQLLKAVGFPDVSGIFLQRREGLQRFIDMRNATANGKIIPRVIKTLSVHNQALEDKLADIIFSSINQDEVCDLHHPTGYRTKTCRCCFTNHQTRGSSQVRLAELQMSAASLNLPVENIDYPRILKTMYEWYNEKYGRLELSPARKPRWPVKKKRTR